MQIVSGFWDKQSHSLTVKYLLSKTNTHSIWIKECRGLQKILSCCSYMSSLIASLSLNASCCSSEKWVIESKASWSTKLLFLLSASLPLAEHSGLCFRGFQLLIKIVVIIVFLNYLFILYIYLFIKKKSLIHLSS